MDTARLPRLDPSHQPGQLSFGHVVVPDLLHDRILAAALHHPVDYTPYEGFRVRGWPALVLSRGRVVARDGQFVGGPGGGKFLSCGPSTREAIS